MDPKACLWRWLRAVEAGDVGEARAAARDYREWRRKGGAAVRVGVHPASDLFMRGVRYADVDRFGDRYLTLHNPRVRLAARNVAEVV